MKISELIDLLEYHIKEYGDIDVVNFRGTVVLENGLEIESDSTVMTDLFRKNAQGFVELCEDYDSWGIGPDIGDLDDAMG